MWDQKIMSMRPQDLPLRHLEAIIDLKIPILYYRNIIVALSQFDNVESKNHGAETSGPTLRHLDAKID